jgi:hypothetical protein
LYKMGTEKIRIQRDDPRWDGQFWTWESIFALYRNEGNIMPDEALIEKSREVALAINQMDAQTRYLFLKVAEHEELRGLRVRKSETYSDDRAGP